MRRPALDRGELAAAVLLLGSIPVSIALLGVLFGSFGGLGAGAAVAPFLPPFAAALAVGERAFPAEARAAVVRATLIATFCSVGAFVVGGYLLTVSASVGTGVASLAALAAYAAGGVAVVRDSLRDERLWPAVGAASAALFWLLSAVGG